MSSENSGGESSEKNTDRNTLVNIYEHFVANITGGQQRRGQAWMNALAVSDPELYAEIHGTEADCFYNDRFIDAFKARVFGGSNANAS